ncbi:MAG: class F sortase [Anaerolineaceae bacterium]
MVALVLGGVAGMLGAAVAVAADSPGPDLKFRAFAPAVARSEDPTPPPPAAPTPRPQPYDGAVQTLYLASAALTMNPPVEQRDTTFSLGREVLQDPTAPAQIAWYPRFGRPGFAGSNSLFAAHVNYVNYGNGPFAHLTSASVGDALYVTMDNGQSYAYTVRSVEVISLDSLNMDAVVFPALDSSTERVTLISCGGTFVPNANGVGGEYNSRVILVAERYVP